MVYSICINQDCVLNINSLGDEESRALYRKSLVDWLSKQNIFTRNMYPELNRQSAFSTHPQHSYKFKNSNYNLNANSKETFILINNWFMIFFLSVAMLAKPIFIKA